jgi:hypothetical protein
MSNADVFRAFADGRRARSTTVSSEHVAGGTVLYSYDTPIAFIGDSTGTAVFDARKYSPTTSKQVTQAKRAVGAWQDMPHETFRATVEAMGAQVAYAR